MALEFGTGWRPDYDFTQKYCESLGVYGSFASGATQISGSGEGKVVLLYKNYEKVVGNLDPHNQGVYGTCVSHGWGMGIDVLQATEIAAGEREKWVAKVSTEYIYGISRVEVGGGRLRGDGSSGSWAAAAVTKYGTLHRQVYLDKYDLRRYDGELSRRWGARPGVPDELEPIGKEHPVRTVSLVTSYKEARDAIANGYPIPVCSNYGFVSTRDAKGFLRPRGSWNHAMLFCGVDDADGRPGLLCWNSWGAGWVNGPKRHDQPEGSFWVDADVADAMLKQNDSYAISGYEGFKAQDLDYYLI